MSRPAALIKDETLYWVIRLYDSDNELVDADSTPTVAIRKNGAATIDAVSVTKRAATTGIYDCAYDPASETEGDQYTVEESATISAIGCRRRHIEDRNLSTRTVEGEEFELIPQVH